MDGLLNDFFPPLNNSNEICWFKNTRWFPILMEEVDEKRKDFDLLRENLKYVNITFHFSNKNFLKTQSL